MSYQTHWDLLDKNKEVVQSFTRICFSNHTDTPFHIAQDDVEEDDDDWDTHVIRSRPSTLPPHYFHYKFHNTTLSDAEVEKYLLFLRATPEFKHLMPSTLAGIKKMVKDKAYTADLTVINGSQLFGILSLLRGMVEDKAVVRSVIRFNPKLKHGMPHLSIIKASGCQYCQNSNHWITNRVDLKNLLKGINGTYAWTSAIPALETGLVSGLFDVFQHDGDGYYVMTSIPSTWANAMLDEQRRKERAKKKKIAAPKTVLRPVEYDTSLQVAW